MVQECVPVFKLGEILLASELIVHKSGISESAGQMLKVSKQDVTAQVRNTTDALNRLHAFYVGLEYTGQLAFSKSGAWSRRGSGSPSWLMSSSKESMLGHADGYSRYAVAVHKILSNHKDLWSECRLECLRGGGLPRNPKHDDDGDSDVDEVARTKPARADRKRSAKDKAGIQELEAKIKNMEKAEELRQARARHAQPLDGQAHQGTPGGREGVGCDTKGPLPAGRMQVLQLVGRVRQPQLQEEAHLRDMREEVPLGRSPLREVSYSFSWHTRQSGRW